MYVQLYRLLVRAPRLGLGTSLRLLSASVPEVTEPIPAPPPDAAGPVYPEKIRELVHEISQLTLVETAQLNELLKVYYFQTFVTVDPL